MLAEEHGVSDRVEAVCASSFDLDTEKEFDLVISETIGYLAYDEGIVEIMNDARKRFLRKDGQIIPEAVALYAAAAAPAVDAEASPVGIDLEFDSFARLALNSPRILKRPRSVKMLTRPARLLSSDLRKAEITPPLSELRANWNLTGNHFPDRVIVWVESRLAPGVKLSTRRRTTSWFPTAYRFALPTRPFTSLEFSLTLTGSTNYWTVTFSDDNGSETQSYSPELAATEMIAVARGSIVSSTHGRPRVTHEQVSTPVIELRAAGPEDDDFLRTLYASTRQDEFAILGWTEVEQQQFLAMQFTMQRNAYKMQCPHAVESVVLCDGSPAGRLIVDASGEAVSLMDIAVLPEFRNRGVASRLIRNLQSKTSTIVLCVDKANPAAERLYAKHGFVVTNETDLTKGMRWERSRIDK